MRVLRLSVVVVCTLAVSQVFVGCSPSLELGVPSSSAPVVSSSASSSATFGSGSAGALPNQEVPVARMDMPSPVDMPLNDYIHIITQAKALEFESWRAVAKPVHERQQKLIAKCMHNLGFTYYPRPLSEELPDPVLGEDLRVPWLPDSRDLVDQYGYGASPDSSMGWDTPSEAEQKNLAYFESLSKKAQRAYNFALSGRDGYDESEKPGCVQSTEREAGGSIDSVYKADNSWYEEPLVGISRLFGVSINSDRVPPESGTLQADKSAVKLNREWGQCMDKAGLLTDVNLKLLEKVGPITSFLNATRGSTKLSAAENADRAHKLAVADYECRITTNYVDRFTKIQFDLEQKWLNEHKKELDKLVAMWEQQEKKNR